jgi:hypothetical protein
MSDQRTADPSALVVMMDAERAEHPSVRSWS